MITDLPGIENLDVNRKRVIVRVDFNVPIDNKTGQIGDSGRIEKAIPTINYLLESNAAVILITHLGRPKSHREKSLSTKILIEKLRELIQDTDIIQAPFTTPEKLEKLSSKLEPGQILLLENIRYYPEETSDESKVRKAFAKKMARLGDLIVNDAFGACHRAHTTVKELPEILPSYAGFLLKKEIQILSTILNNPARPFVAIIGGAKVSSKMAVLSNLVTRVDSIIIGGGMAYTFLKSKGLKMGDSLVEDEHLSQAFQINDKANFNETGFYLPDDHTIASEFSPDAKVKASGLEIPEGWMGMDIGPKTIKKFEKIIKDAKTILWNGPMGVFEMEPFSKGTMSIAKSLSKNKGTTIVGGGDSMSALKKSGLEDSITHISTGGGATLEFLEGKKLPGIQALLKKV
ncbi:MAG: phosphoglycerate kinase [Leptospirales bacterium]